MGGGDTVRIKSIALHCNSGDGFVGRVALLQNLSSLGDDGSPHVNVSFFLTTDGCGLFLLD
jgi:hypothetical protein